MMKIPTALESAQRVFLDTAPVIYYIEKNPNYLSRVIVVFEAIDAGTLTGVVSPITLTECLVLPYRLGKPDVAQAFIRILCKSENMVFIAIEDQIASRAADLRARYNITLADSLQISTALVAGCDVFLTNDDTLKRISEIKVIVMDMFEP